MNRFKKWAQKEYPLAYRVLALIPAGLLFALLIPYLLVRAAPLADAALGLPGFNPGLPGLIAGGIFILIGAVYALWSIASQLLRARGTPLPVMPTQELLVTVPFDQCRNPMTFGTISLYLGVSILAGSITALALTILLSALLISYLKLVEETELEARFGDDYLAYKSQTPFLIPRIFH